MPDDTSKNPFCKVPPAKSEATLLLMVLKDSVENAIDSGDWIVDGANDPEAILSRIEDFLISESESPAP